MGEGNKKLSKRDPESNLFHHRDRGFIPEGLLNYLALLGWSIAPDRDVFSLDEMVAAFDVVDVNPNPARFDLKKAESINGDHIRLLDPTDFADAPRAVPRRRWSATPTDGPSAPCSRGRAARAGAHAAARRGAGAARVPVHRRRRARSSRPMRCRAARRGRRVLDAALGGCSSDAEDLTTAAIEAALRAGPDRRAGLKPRVAFGPLRSAVSGRRISPPLFESMEILGRESTLARIEKLLARS